MLQRGNAPRRRLASLDGNLPNTLPPVAAVLPVTVTVVTTTLGKSVTAMMQTAMNSVVPKMLTDAGNPSMVLGDPLRGRALRCNLRFAPISAAIPVASVRCRSLRARLAKSPAHRAVLPDTIPIPVLSSSRRRFAPRSSPASARLGITPCVAGAGFAAHRASHFALHDPPHRCRRSCGRSCGARPHFAPHRAGSSCPHDCGQRRRRLRQRAAHDCPRLRPHRPPLNRDCESISSPQADFHSSG